MAHMTRGAQYVAAAYALLRRAKTAEELRLAQAVLLPCELGLTIEQTAKAIGRSTGATCEMRVRFAKLYENPLDVPRNKHELRNRAHAEIDVEARILDEIFACDALRSAPVGSKIKPAIEVHLGKVIALSSVYRMLARHGWRRQITVSRVGESGQRVVRGVWCKEVVTSRRRRT